MVSKGQQKVDTTVPVDGSYHECIASSEYTGSLYVVGGWNSGKLATVQVYDIDSSSWLSNVPSLNVARYMPSCIVEPMTQMLYVIGGGDTNSIERINVVDIESESWTIMGYLPQISFQLRNTVADGIIYVTGQPQTSTVYTIDTVCNRILNVGL